MSLEIDCAGERLVLFPEKVLAWPRTASLIVADLHFGKPAAFRKSGIAVPESTTAFDLDRLDKVLRESVSKRLIILGDFFHAAAGLQPEMMEAVEAWCKTKSKLEIILVPGNHDKKSGQPPACWNIQNVDDGWSDAPFSFWHAPKKVQGSYVLSGHLHPSISLREKFGSGLRAPCFWFGRNGAVLPAFGSFTGTRAIEPNRGDHVFAIGPDEVIEVTTRFFPARKGSSTGK